MFKNKHKKPVYMKLSIANIIMFNKKRVAFLAPHGAHIIWLPQIRPVTSKSQKVEVMTSCFKKLVQALNKQALTKALQKQEKTQMIHKKKHHPPRILAKNFRWRA